jgi:hypothetical protein
VLVHKYADASLVGHCNPGEEVTAVFLVWRGKSYRSTLSTTHTILLDSFARHTVALNAAELAERLNSDLFACHHASNRKGNRVVRTRTSRTASSGPEAGSVRPRRSHASLKPVHVQVWAARNPVLTHPCSFSANQFANVLRPWEPKRAVCTASLAHGGRERRCVRRILSCATNR